MPSKPKTAIFGYDTEQPLPESLGDRLVFIHQHGRHYWLPGHWMQPSARAYARRHGIVRIVSIRHVASEMHGMSR